ncbi:MAG: hypothetical protein EDM74_06365 [Armatimonadetes bacterium]|nr:MAG: hypothetical protein EDM74_06365 [Armatimonadota bacterium]
MLGLPLLLASVLCLPDPSQGRSGVYVAPGAEAQSWAINSNRTVIWQGQQYVPLGAVLPGSPVEIAQAAASGIKDVAVELPAGGMGWEAAFQSLEAGGLRYMLTLSSLAPGPYGVAVEPQGYRFTGITNDRHIEFTVPGAGRALAFLVTQRDGAVQERYSVATPEGRFSLDVKPRTELEHVLIVYPVLQSHKLIDCWDRFDEHRDELLQSLRSHPPGPGLRGIVNPLGRVIRMRAQRTFVPTSGFFRMELRAYLELRYRTVETVQRAWSMSASGLSSFEDLAKLVPLWSGSRGLSLLLDPDSGKTYPCESRRSAIWDDLETVINDAMVKRFSRLTQAIKKVCNVPVIQDWEGWASPYESGRVAMDGLGARVDGLSPSLIAASAGPVASSTSRWSESGLMVATEVGGLGSAPDTNSLLGAVEDLLSLGFRGFYFRASGRSVLEAIVQIAERVQSDTSLSLRTFQALYYPESAAYPAVTMKLPGGYWWLPSPAPGDRIDLGRSFFAYRFAEPGNEFVALWTRGPAGRIKLRFLDSKNLTFQTVDGTDPNPKNVRGGVEVNVGPLPLVIRGTQEIPIPEPAYQEAVARFDALLLAAEERRIDDTEFRFLFRDALNGFERNPGGSFGIMRQQVIALGSRLGGWNWIEAENVRDTSFSEIVEAPGTSGRGALSLSTPFDNRGERYFAEYSFLPRSNADLEVWIAARIEPIYRKAVTLEIGGQILRIQGDPISYYGRQFGWYRLGLTRLESGQTKLTLWVDGLEGIDVQIDAIVLYPGQFSPIGPMPPDFVVGPSLLSVR